MEPITNKRQEDFKRELEPLFQMLEAKETILPRSEWIAMVNSTKERVVQAPDQFLSNVFRPDASLKITIDSIFKERLN